MRFYRLHEDYLIEGIADVKKYYPTVNDEDFNRIIKLDPTTNIEKDRVGTYSKWLLNLFKNKKLTNEGHVKDLLNRFEKEKKNLKNKDIMSYKSMEDVDAALDDITSYSELSARQQLRQTQKAVRKTNIEEDADLVYEDSDWEVWVPKTYEASCKLGQGTNWCTASTSNEYYYNYYKNNYGGDYYININKHDPNKKYQFHFESKQFMDDSDYEIDLEAFMIENLGLSKFYTPICQNILKNDLNFGVEFIYTTETLSNEFANRNMYSDFLEACFEGDLWNFFDYDSYDADDEEAINALKYYIDDETKEFLKAHNLTISDDVVIIASRSAIPVSMKEGAMDACWKDFNNSFVDMMDKVAETYPGMTWRREEFGDIPIKGWGDLIINLDSDKLNCFKLIQQDDDMSNNILEEMVSNWRFYEPYGGWDKFDELTYNERLRDDLGDLLLEH